MYWQTYKGFSLLLDRKWLATEINREKIKKGVL